MNNLPNTILILGALYAPYLFEVGDAGQIVMIAIIVMAACVWQVPAAAKEKIALLKSQTHLNERRAFREQSQGEANEAKKIYYNQRAHYYMVESDISEHELKKMKEK